MTFLLFFFLQANNLPFSPAKSYGLKITRKLAQGRELGCNFSIINLSLDFIQLEQMVNSRSIADLDELVLLCRDDRAKAYISEATSCYRSGAYRSAIVATWIAVCYDIIDKLRELALAGDREAETLIESMDRARMANDVTKALKFEHDLLAMARDKFELLSHLEFIDLERLREDRKAVNSLSSGPLRNPRESLIRNFVVVLLKDSLSNDTDWKDKKRYLAALKAIQRLHPDSFINSVNGKFTTLIRVIEDEDLNLVVRFITEIPDVWDEIEQDAKNRLHTFVQNLPAEHLSDLEELLQIPCFEYQARERLNRATREELLSKAVFSELPKAIGDRFVDLYLESQNYDQANSWGKHLQLYATELTAEQQRRLISNAPQNSQVLNSRELPRLLMELRKSEAIAEQEFEALLHKHCLELA